MVTIIGAAIGMNAALLNIITEWLSDIKMGYCSTAFYLNEKFCCWGEDNGQSSNFRVVALAMSSSWHDVLLFSLCYAGE